MRKGLLLLVFSALIAGIGLAGCSPKQDATTQNPTTSPPGPAGAPVRTPTPALPVSISWPDIPLYPSLRQIEKASQPFPPASGYVKAEFRVYQTGDSLEKVAAFYKGQMPGKGWTEMPLMETPQIFMGTYTKNSEADIAWVYIVFSGSSTEVILGRASK